MAYFVTALLNNSTIEKSVSKSVQQCPTTKNSRRTRVGILHRQKAVMRRVQKVCGLTSLAVLFVVRLERVQIFRPRQQAAGGKSSEKRWNLYREQISCGKIYRNSQIGWKTTRPQVILSELVRLKVRVNIRIKARTGVRIRVTA